MPEGRPLTIDELKALASHPRVNEVLSRLNDQERQAIERFRRLNVMDAVSSHQRDTRLGLSRATGIRAVPSGLAGARERGGQMGVAVEQLLPKALEMGAAETAGGLAGGLVGGIPGAMGGAALARAVRGQLQGEDIGDSLLSAGMEGGLEAVPVVGRGLKSGARFFMNNALKPGLRVVDDAGRLIRGPTATLTTRFPEVDIVGEALERKIPIRNSGLQAVQRNLGTSRRRAVEAVDAAEQARPRVAGLLTEGTTDVPLGDIPVPSGGQLATPRADVTQFRRQSEATSLQGMNPDDPIDPIFGGLGRSAAPEAVADVVSGSGAIRLPRSSANVSSPAAPLIPGRGQTIGADEQLEYVRRLQREIAETEGGRDRAKLDALITDFFPEGSQTRPRTIGQAQRQKEASQEVASRLYRTGKGTQKAQFRQALARGEREAVERRVPGIKDINRETETLLALREALHSALDKESRSSRFSLGGLLDNPRLHGAIAQGARRSGAPLASPFTPGTLRVLEDLLLPSHEPTPRRQLQAP